MSEKINCPIILAECRFELCPFYYDEKVKYIGASWLFNDGGYEVRSGCENRLCESCFTARKATIKEIKNAGIGLYAHQEYKYEKGE